MQDEEDDGLVGKKFTIVISWRVSWKRLFKRGRRLQVSSKNDFQEFISGRMKLS